jgi:hypothetical protein
MTTTVDGTERSWKRADGKDKSKACDFAVTGVVVVGPGRGEAFKVCSNKDKCRTHWAAEQREKAKRAASSGGTSVQERAKREQEKDRQQQAQEEAERARWHKAMPTILDALAEKVRKAPAGAGGVLAEIILGRDRDDSKHAGEWIPRGRSAEDLVRHLAFMDILDSAGDYAWAREGLTKHAKALGVDVKKILQEAAPAKEAAKEKKK